MTQKEKIQELVSRIKEYETYDNIPDEKLHEFMGELKQIERMKISLDLSMVGPALAIGKIEEVLQAEIDRRKKE